MELGPTVNYNISYFHFYLTQVIEQASKHSEMRSHHTVGRPCRIMRNYIFLVNLFILYDGQHRSIKKVVTPVSPI